MLTLAAYNNSELSLLAREGLVPMNTIANGQFAFQLPQEVMRWGPKLQEVQAAGDGVAPAVKVFPAQPVEGWEGPIVPADAMLGAAKAITTAAATAPARTTRPIGRGPLLPTPRSRFLIAPRRHQGSCGSRSRCTRLKI